MTMYGTLTHTGCLETRPVQKQPIQVKIELVMYFISVNGCHCNKCKFVFTITRTQIPVTSIRVNVNAA